MIDKESETCGYDDIAKVDIICSICFLFFVVSLLIFIIINRVVKFAVPFLNKKIYVAIIIIMTTLIISINVNVQAQEPLEAGTEGVMFAAWIPLLAGFHLEYVKEYPETKRIYWHYIEMGFVFLSFARDLINFSFWGVRCAKSGERGQFIACLISRLVTTIVLLKFLWEHGKKRTSTEQTGTYGESRKELDELGNGQVKYGYREEKGDCSTINCIGLCVCGAKASINREFKAELDILDPCRSESTKEFSSALSKTLARRRIKASILESWTPCIFSKYVLVICNNMSRLDDDVNAVVEKIKINHFPKILLAVYHKDEHVTVTKGILSEIESEYAEFYDVIGLIFCSKTDKDEIKERNEDAIRKIEDLALKNDCNL